jgi:hypothetical protein
VDDFTMEQPSHCLQADVRMWCDVHGLAAAERQRSKSIKETPGSDEPLVLDWERSRND